MPAAGVKDHGPYGKRGLAVRAAYVCVSLVVWVVTGFGRFSRGRTVILCYHSVRASERAAFARQMRRMRARLVATAQADAQRGRFGAPRAALTFDDAYACLLPNVLQESGDDATPLTIYAVSGCLGRTPIWPIPEGHPDAREVTMTQEELRKAAATPGVTIGSHSVSHPRLHEVAPARLAEELASSKAALEAIVGRPIDEIALPHGSWDDRIPGAARAAGYARVMTLEPVLAPSGLPAPLLGRFLMTPGAWGLEFLLTIDGAYRWLPLMRRMARAVRDGGRARSARRNGGAAVAG